MCQPYRERDHDLAVGDDLGWTVRVRSVLAGTARVSVGTARILVVPIGPSLDPCHPLQESVEHPFGAHGPLLEASE